MTREGGEPTEPAGDLPLSQYALIGDGVTAALVGRNGSIDWYCLGRFDGPAVFCRLLDAQRGGFFQVAPEGPFHAAQGYVGDTNVLATEFETATGRLRLTDFMPLPGSAGARPSQVLRKLEGLSGEVRVHIAFVPTFDFARAATRVELTPGGCSARAGEAGLRLFTPAPLVLGPGGAEGHLSLRAGEARWLLLAPESEGLMPPGPLADSAEAALRSTLEAWERWAARGHFPGPYSHPLRRSALALKLLIHSPTGAMVAAPTTSLPEAPGGVRNWDYRFTWLRDASWLVNALMGLGYHDESMAFIAWLESLGLGRTMPAVFYDLDGRVPNRERELWHLRGYSVAQPVRLGNAAAGQVQHDVFGEVISAIHLCSEGMPSMRPLRPGLWKLVSALARMAVARWREADHGLWEVRDRPRHFFSSRLLCWLAVDRALRVARRDGLPGPWRQWELERERMRHALLEEGFDRELGAFTRAVGERELDASALLVPRMGLLPAEDERVRGTVARIRERLEVGGLVRRYTSPDGLPGTEGAFTACSFWLVDCLARQGELEEARAVFDRVLRGVSSVGLLSEEIGLQEGALLGNYPQAFSHLALIQAALSIADAEERERGALARSSPGSRATCEETAIAAHEASPQFKEGRTRTNPHSTGRKTMKLKRVSKKALKGYAGLKAFSGVTKWAMLAAAGFGAYRLYQSRRSAA